MKLLPVFLAAVAVLTAPAALSAAEFEGKVRMRMSDPKGGARDVDYFIKPGLARVEFALSPEQKMTTIRNVAKQETVILMPGQNMYFAISDADVADAAGAKDVSFEETGEKQDILGYPCTKYISKDKNLTTEIWATEQLGSFVGFSGGNPMSKKKSAAPAWERALKGKNFFPLRVVSQNKKGAEQFRLEAVTIDKSSQPDSLFAIPTGYQKFNIGGLMKGLLPGAR